MPSVNEALQRLERGLASCRRENVLVLKLVHGYGSSGAGGEIRIAVQKQLRAMEASGEIRRCIFGEDWRTADEASWALVRERPELKHDPDLGRSNQGITVVVL